MAKVTPAQQVLLDRLQRAPSKLLIVASYHGQGPKGGKVAEGGREVASALALEKAGLLQRLELHRAGRYQNGFCVHVRTFVFTLPGA